MSKWFRKKFDAINWFAFEMLKTLSNEPSFIASKRIERIVLFTASVGIICCFVWQHRNTIVAADVLLLVGLMGGWAGFNAVQLGRERKADAEIKADIKKAASDENSN